MTPDDSQLRALAVRLGELLRERGWTVTAAESCTGGWIAKVLTDIPGSSQWFTHGFVTYSNDAKRDMLGVPAAELRAHGAVSETVVAAMAAGAAQRAGSECAVAVSGIAGPDGGSPAKPVGTVWFAWLTPGISQAQVQVFAGDRDAVRRQSVAAVLERLLADLGTAK
jgi:nicotinamide-nucleotide amidase